MLDTIHRDIPAEPAHVAAVGGRRRRLPTVSTVQLLVGLILLLVLMPFFKQVQYGELIEAILMTVVLLSALMSVGTHPGVLVAGTILVVPALVARWISQFRPDALAEGVAPALAALFLAFVIVELLRFVIRTRRVTTHVLSAAISVYLLLGLFWAVCFRLVDLFNPGSYRMMIGTPVVERLTLSEAVYFSFSTLSTAAYGDIVPYSELARMLANVEAVSGMFYVTLLIARVASHYSTHSIIRTRQEPAPSPPRIDDEASDGRRPQ